MSEITLLQLAEPIVCRHTSLKVRANVLTDMTGLRWYVQIVDVSSPFRFKQPKHCQVNIYVQTKMGPYHPADYSLVHTATSLPDAVRYMGLLMERYSRYHENIQKQVDEWLRQALPEYTAPVLERTARFAEEAIELCQAAGASREDVHAMVDYVFNRPVGEPKQEVAGTMITLAALASVMGIDMIGAFVDEMGVAWTPEIMEKVRNRQLHKLQFKGVETGV